MDKIKTTFGIIRKVKNWPIYFLDYFGLVPPKERVYYLDEAGGLKISTRPKLGDRSTINEIFIHKNYPYTIGETDTIVDIGAHIGVFTVYAAKLAKKGAVYSFEPDPGNFSQLKKNVELNGLNNAKIFNEGIFSKEGTFDFYVSDQHSGGNSMLKVSGEKISAHFTTLTSVMDSNKIEQIDFLKIDTEGAEYDILLSTPASYFSRISRIGLETHDWMTEQKGPVLKKFLEELGFSVSENNGMLYAYGK